jgi:signal transduction histidine kinase
MMRRVSQLKALALPGGSWLLVALQVLIVLRLEAADPTGERVTVLTNAQQVLELGTETARSSHDAASFRGVITFPVAGMDWAFVQDSSAGILVLYTNRGFQAQSGQLVELTGRIGAGLHAPIVRDAQFRLVGQGSLPEARPISAARLAAGDLFGQWVEVEGAVRDVAREPQKLVMFIASGGIRFHAVVQPSKVSSLPVEWLDAQVKLRGVCWTDTDRENKPAGFTLYLPGEEHMTLVRPGSSNVFDTADLSPAIRADLHHQSDRRVKMRGTVVFQSPAGVLFLEDEVGPFQARPLAPLGKAHPNADYISRPMPAALKAGTRLELVGAPAKTVFAPALQDVEFRVLGRTAVPQPKSISAAEALSGRYDRSLVSLKARVLAHDRRASGRAVNDILVLQSEDTTFEALWETSGTNALPIFSDNALLQVAGICITLPDELNRGRSFRLVLRDPGELKFLGSAPPWVAWHVERILGIAILLGLGAMAVIALLRRQVAQRTAALVAANSRLQSEVAERQKAQAELHHALAAERELGDLKSRFVSMVSHEFRTPLGIIMSAADILQNYLDRLAPEKRREHLQDIFQATRRMADLMEEVLLLGRVESGRVQCKPEPMDPVAFCSRLVEDVSAASSQRCPVHFKAQEALPAATADQALLRHIVTNLLSNAVKYSRPGGTVHFEIQQRDDKAIFVFRDRGIGIPEADAKQLFQAFHRGRNVGEIPGTGLGLVIVKRCVELHRGTIEFETREGEGTVFKVCLPIFAMTQTKASVAEPGSGLRTTSLTS